MKMQQNDTGNSQPSYPLCRYHECMGVDREISAHANTDTSGFLEHSAKADFTKFLASGWDKTIRLSQ